MTPHRVVLKPKSKNEDSVAMLVDEVTQATRELEEILQGLVAS